MAGRAPSDWSSRALFELAEYQNGMAFRPADTKGNGLPIIKIAELNGGIGPSTGRARGEVDPRKVIRPGDLLFAWSGSVGVYKWTGPQAVLNQHIFKVSSKDGVDQPFLRYLLESQLPTFQRVVDDQATTMGHVKVSDLKRLKVLVPPLPEQRAIASVLGSLDDDILIRQGGESGGLKRLFKHLMKRLLSGEWSVDHAKEWLRTTRPTVQAYDDKIELNRRMNQTLEEIARALFKFWFVDFGPVRAKAEGRWKKGESLPGMPADMWDLWPSEFEDSELGEIPSGWKVGPLGDVAEVVSEPEDPSSANALEPYIGLEHMESRCLAVYRTGSMRDVKTAKLRFQIGDILFGRLRPYFHKVAVAWEDGYCSTTVAVVRPRTPPWHAFLLGHMNRSDFVDFATANSNGTTMPSISTKDLLSYQVTTPPTSLVRRLTEIQTPIIARIRMAASEIRTLEGLRDALLPKLLSGEIRVPVNGGR